MDFKEHEGLDKEPERFIRRSPLSDDGQFEMFDPAQLEGESGDATTFGDYIIGFGFACLVALFLIYTFG